MKQKLQRETKQKYGVENTTKMKKKNPLQGLNVRCEHAEERTIVFEDRSFAIIQSGENRKKRMKTNQQTSKTCGTQSSILMGIIKEDREKEEQKKI